MQLHGFQPQSLRAGDHLLQRRIAEDADVLQRRSGDHRFGLGVIHRSRRGRDEDQPTVNGAGLPGHLGILRARQAAHFVLAEQHAFNRRFQIRLLHQGGADQEAVGEVAQLAHFGIGMDAGFADHRDIRAETRRQLTGAVKVNRHIAQVAVVNAHHLRLQGDGALQFLFIADFGQHAHIQAVSHRRELTILFIVEHREHQQTGVGLIVARQVDLVRVDGEVLTQDRLRRDLADDRQEIEAALEIFLITQHRDRRGVVLVDAGDRCRIEILANQPLRR
ncbi:hypothetical protein SB00612_00933 [Klebsiella pneumoniae]|nr:hypothetical protein SB00612_00933 [Klebsiella pneumoniae]